MYLPDVSYLPASLVASLPLFTFIPLYMQYLYPRSNIPATGSHMILQERCGKVTGSHRKAPEIAGSGSSIPTGNLLDFFPVDSDQFPVLSNRNRSEIIRKNPKIFRLEYCFHVPVTSGAFLPEPARIFRPGYVQLYEHRL